jgi:hypothetical protein
MDNDRVDEIRTNHSLDFKSERVSFLDTFKNSESSPDLSPDLIFKNQLFDFDFDFDFSNMQASDELS